MYNEIFIIGSDSDLAAMEALRPAVTAGGYSLNVICSTSDNELLKNAVNASKVALWLTPSTDEKVYEAAQNRRLYGVETVNVFGEPTQLSQSQRAIVGRNRSVFSGLVQNVAQELMMLFGIPQTASVNKAAPTVPQPKKVAPATPANPTTPSSSAIFQPAPEPSISTSDNGSVEEEEKTPSPAVKPWKAFLIIIAVMIGEYCIEDAHQFYNDEILPYIMFAACAFIEMACAGGVMGWREKHGKTFFSAIVMWIGGLLGCYYAWLFVKNLYNFIF